LETAGSRRLHLILATVIQTEISRLLIEGARELGVFLTGEHISAFERYLDELKVWAAHMSLIRREGDREIVLKDFLDSLTVVRYLSESASVMDLGSGAGFPGIPAKIVRPDLKMVLLEARRKKVFFLKNLIRYLGLERTEAHWYGEGREIERNLRGAFDYVISRAFGSLQEFSSKGLPFLRQGGILLAMKAKKGKAELGENLPALEKMGLRLAFLNGLRLPFLGHERTLIGLRKEK
jgi:16S rRNA (guanine527-N7)-methyltransferase